MLQGKDTPKTALPLLIVLFALIAHLGIAHAQENDDPRKLYFTGLIGLGFLEDADNTSPGFADINSEYEAGFNTGVALGYDWGKFRAEFEISYKENDIDELQTLGVPAASTGDFSALSYLLNVFYDFENSSLVTPYLGAGLGIATINANNVASAGIINSDDEDTEFAFKFALGAAYHMSPSIDLLADYSYFGTSDPEFTNSVTGANFDSEFLSHTLNFGVRFKF